MKKHTRIISIITIVFLSMCLATGCGKKDDTQNTTPEETQEDNTDRVSPEDESKVKPGEEENKDLDTLSLELGNDIGKDIIALFIRASEDDEWLSIRLTNTPWRSGYLIPIELEAEELPNPENGWDVLVEFSDTTEQTFTDVKINTEKLIILTADEVIYSS